MLRICVDICMDANLQSKQTTNHLHSYVLGESKAGITTAAHLVDMSIQYITGKELIKLMQMLLAVCHCQTIQTVFQGQMKQYC